MRAFGRGYGPVALGIALQIGTSDDVQSCAVSTSNTEGSFAHSFAGMRQSIPPLVPIVTAGFSSGVTSDWVLRALFAGASHADAICFHVVGDDLVAVFKRQFAIIEQAMRAAELYEKPIWLTAVRCTHRDVAQHALQLAALLALPELRGIARCYVDTPFTDPIVVAAMKRS